MRTRPTSYTTGRIRSVSLATASRYSSPAGSPAALASAACTALARVTGWRVNRSSAHDSPVAVVS
ncbi:Uncharacterised protein [Mycobacterium tuberculosis]|uniref:Uncharacterized protein n=1 Tax=Mycobacterium tuberculosis TaxID=1773 RepID=A0A654T4B9_MYCTX|nr:Uncharacterised protein [Mycobacterium tuberculosis]CNL70660.1 Uncharacterised protein [Mycobacterium tuberculosis]CNM62685.1 Uncharacterised protein [Mycobacterium tuberculosis]COW61190.1 Uncharacterised protein [Mycobacterium tuberculosis]COX29720.1 Uncharacterised protein [Mycobacterium tuberculosis]